MSSAFLTITFDQLVQLSVLLVLAEALILITFALVKAIFKSAGKLQLYEQWFTPSAIVIVLFWTILLAAANYYMNGMNPLDAMIGAVLASLILMGGYNVFDDLGMKDWFDRLMGNLTGRGARKVI